MEVTLFDTMERVALYPFTEIRAVADLRTGLYTLRERWAHFFRQPVHVATALYLSRKYEPAPGADHLYINAATFPDPAFCTALQQLQPGHLLVHGDTVIALRTNHHPTFGFAATDFPAYRVHAFQPAHSLLRYPFQLTQWNGYWLEQDFRQVTYNRRSEPLPACAQVTGNGPIFVEPGAVLEHCFINTQQGPVYIGAGSSVLDGSCIRGPFALLKQGVVKMGALIYGATTIGAHSVAGGEIKNSILFDAANKAHEGYLGDAVVGSWCNLGAGTSCSNLKNTAAEVKIWNKHLHQWIPAGSKCGVMLGDYSRTAIHTALNTGTVTGISCQVLHTGFVPKFVNDFTWNCATGERYVYEKALRDIRTWMHLKQADLQQADTEILLHLFSKQSTHV